MLLQLLPWKIPKKKYSSCRDLNVREKTKKQDLGLFFIIKDQLEEHGKTFSTTVSPNTLQKTVAVEISVETANLKNIKTSVCYRAHIKDVTKQLASIKALPMNDILGLKMKLQRQATKFLG